MQQAQQQIPAQQVQAAPNQNGLLQTTVAINQRYWIRITVQMLEGGNPRTAANLPYVVVRQAAENAPWSVVTTGITGTSNGEARFSIPGAGRYRIYVKEPGRNFLPDTAFTIPFHQFANGQDSAREVQPWWEMNVVAAGAQSFNITRALPNTLGRAANLYPAAGAATQLNAQHTTSAHALDMGNHRITNQLWSDISQTYGRNHPTIAASTNRVALEAIYGEGLVPIAGQENGRQLVHAGRTINFEAMATQGGRNTLGFAGGTAMTADECLRKTHPTVLDFWLTAMSALNITYARVTGAWRPHTGSTRHRYSLALDLTHLRRQQDDGGELAEVEIHLHRDSGADAKPTATDAQTNTALKRRRRAFSRDFHRYLAQRRQAGELGWLGGPWALTYADVGLTGATQFIKTDAIHVHHVHLSVGTDQP